MEKLDLRKTPATVERMRAFARENGYVLCGKHHEIYLRSAARPAVEAQDDPQTSYTEGSSVKSCSSSAIRANWWMVSSSSS